MPARRFVGNYAALSPAAAAGTPTVAALTPSSVYQSDPANGIAKARDGNSGTNYTSASSESPWTLIIQLSSAGKLRYIQQTLRNDAPGFGMGVVYLDHSDDGTTWTAGSDSPKTFAGAPGTGGATPLLTFADDGAHVYWRIRCTLNMEGDTMPAFVSFVELVLAADTAGAQLLV